MRNLTDYQVVVGLRRKDNKSYEILYKFYYPSVRHFIVKNNGTADDAMDIFQETLCVLLEKVPKDDFTLTSSLKTYIFAISSNLWLKRLRDSNKLIKTDVDVFEKYLSDYEEDDEESEGRNSAHVSNIFKIITNKCVALLKAIFYDGKNIDSVTTEFGYTNKHNAQNQKFKCLEQARKGISKFA